MHEKTKIVEVAGQRWQLARMKPVDGSYIWQRLMAASVKAQLANVDAKPATPEAEQAAEAAIKQATPEERMRGIYGVASMHLTYEDTEFVQRKAMAMVSRMEQLPGDAEARPMAVQTVDGRWTVPDLEDDPFLITKLTMEVLVFNLSPFLGGTGVM